MLQVEEEAAMETIKVILKRDQRPQPVRKQGELKVMEDMIKAIIISKVRGINLRIMEVQVILRYFEILKYIYINS